MVVAGRSAGGEGVWSWISSFDITLAGSYGAKPALKKPGFIFVTVNTITMALRKLHIAHLIYNLAIFGGLKPNRLVSYTSYIS